jgi:hypothetical protein
MLSYLRQFIIPSGRQTRSSGFALLLIIGWVTFSLPGCNSTPSTQSYVNHSLGGVHVDYPSNWELKTSERLQNFIVLESKRGLWQRNSARIEIVWGGFPTTFTRTSGEAMEAMTKDIDRIRPFYEPHIITIDEPPNTIEQEGVEITRAVISIPTIAIPKDSQKNQMGRRDPDLLQTVEIYHLANKDLGRYVAVYVYKGNSEELNNQADGIVSSIIAFIDPSQR